MKNSRRDILIGVEILLLSLLFIWTAGLSIYACRPNSDSNGTMVGIIDEDNPNQEMQIVQTFDPERQRSLILIITYGQLVLSLFVFIGAVYLIFG